MTSISALSLSENKLKKEIQSMLGTADAREECRSDRMGLQPGQ